MSFIKKIKTVLLLSFGALTLIVVVSVFLANLYEDDIKKYALEKISENLTTDIQVGKVDFSLFKKFPSASLQFSNVLIQETFEVKDTLLFAKSVFLEFDIFDLIQKKYEVNAVSIDQSVANLRWNKKGDDNFHFWLETDSEDEFFSFAINDITLTKTSVLVDHKPSNFLLKSQVKEFKADGLFNERNISLSSKVDLIMNKLVKDDLSFSEDYHFTGKVKMNIAEEGVLTFSESDIEIDDLPFNISGLIDYSQESNLLDLSILSEKIKIAKLISHLPKKISNKISDYDFSGLTVLNCKITGNIDANNNPDIYIGYQVENGSIQHISSKTNIKKINSEGKFTQLNNEEEKLTINELRANIEGNNFKIRGWTSDFLHPKFDLNIHGQVDLDDIKKFASINQLEKLQGELNINCRFSGHLASITKIKSKDIGNININGTANINDALFKLQSGSQQFENIATQLVFNNKKTTIATLSGNIADSDFVLSGALDNFLGYLLLKDERLTITANVKSNNLNFNKLLSNEKTTATADDYKLIFPKEIDFCVNMEVGELIFRKFTATNIYGSVSLSNKVFSIEPINFNTAEGNCVGKLSAKANANKDIRLSCILTSNGIDINTLFYEFENFGQNLIVQENIKGMANANIEFSSTLSSALVFDKDNITSTINITIEDGELIDLQSMQAINEYIADNRILSGLIDEKALGNKLQHINFSKLSNTIIIEDNKITIPNMAIQSTAMDITVAGKHSFDNYIDYSLGFEIRDLIATKSKTEFGEIEDDGEGNSFFLSMSGNADNPSFSYDNFAHREKRKEDRQEGKENFKQLIKKEFSGKNKTTGVIGNQNTAEISLGEEKTTTKKKDRKWFEKPKKTAKDKKPIIEEANNEDDDF